MSRHQPVKAERGWSGDHSRLSNSDQRRQRRLVGCALMIACASASMMGVAGRLLAATGNEAPTVPKVVEMEIHPAMRTLSAWLANGVRIHHRFMPYRKGQATAAITIGFGRIDEPEHMRGSVEAAVGALVVAMRKAVGGDNPATEQIDENRLAIYGWVSEDAISFRCVGPTARVSTALDLIADAIRAPRFDQSDLADFIRAHREREERRPALFRALWAAIPSVVYSAEIASRLESTPPDVMERFKAADVQWRFVRAVAKAPVEAALVGDAPRTEAMETLTRTLGKLPTRPRAAGDFTVMHRRPAKTPVVMRVVSPGERSLVWVSLLTPTALEARADVALDVVAAALPGLVTPALHALSQDAGDKIAVRAYHRSGGGAFPEGSLSVYAFVPSDSARAAVDAIVKVLQVAAVDGIASDTIESRKREVLDRYTKRLRDPQAWASILSDLDFRHQDLTVISQKPAIIMAVSQTEVRNAIKAAIDAGAPAQLIVLPAHQDSDKIKENNPNSRLSHPPDADG